MKSRRKAREAALQVIYAVDVGGSTVEEMLESVLEETELSADMAEYAAQLARGIRDQRARIDEELAGYLRDYDYTRLAAIDRNILRIGAYELLFIPEMPPAVSIDEAIEIAKKYSTKESGKFVNGVLGRLLKSSEKASWDPKTAPREFDEELVREVVDEPVVETVDEESEEGKQARRFGQWIVSSDEE